MIIVPKGLGNLVTLVAIDLPGQRVVTRLQNIERYVAFARKHHLVRREQETELVEMLIDGAKFNAAVAELRSHS